MTGVTSPLPPPPYAFVTYTKTTLPLPLVLLIEPTKKSHYVTRKLRRFW
jgi:hypothetical protein